MSDVRLRLLYKMIQETDKNQNCVCGLFKNIQSTLQIFTLLILTINIL